mmetsp:Transcript_19054/g.15957  ORF Transcript_19054/g.15957 Transcript_19054/m.15957 type:complete len:82 (+) Transcript_19054:278-523(+)
MNDRVVERNPELNRVVPPPRADPSSAAKGFPKPKLRAWRSKKLAEANVPLAQRKVLLVVNRFHPLLLINFQLIKLQCIIIP